MHRFAMQPRKKNVEKSVRNGGEYVRRNFRSCHQAEIILQMHYIYFGGFYLAMSAFNTPNKH